MNDMNDIERRLERCFAAVFPELPRSALREAGPETVAAWNSLSAVTLVAVVEEEFAVSINPLELVELDSFRAFQDHLSGKLDVARSGAE
jgi:acyl carrier protein